MSILLWLLIITSGSDNIVQSAQGKHKNVFKTMNIGQLINKETKKLDEKRKNYNRLLQIQHLVTAHLSQFFLFFPFRLWKSRTMLLEIRLFIEWIYIV